MVPRMYTRVVERTRTYTFIWSLVLSLVHELERGLPVLMFSLCVNLCPLLFLSCLPSGLIVSSFCLSINWTYHRTDRTRKQQPCPVGARPAPWAHFVFVLFSFWSLFSFLLDVSVLTFFKLSFSGVRICHGYVTGNSSLQVARDGIPLLVSAVPLCTGTTALHVLFCFLPSREAFFVSIASFVTTGWISGK